MKTSRYETQKMLAQYLEAEWGDIIPFNSSSGIRPSTSQSISFYSRVAHEICEHMPLSDVKLIDIGCGTGRLSFELAKLRPKANFYLYDTSAQFKKFSMALLGKEPLPETIPTIGNIPNHFEEILLPTGFEAYSHKFSATNTHVLHEKPASGEYDFVVCLNVIDRLPLAEQAEFISWIFELLRPNGVIVMASPYDYKEFTGDEISDLRSAFRPYATILADADYDYIMRVSARHTHHYRSHVVIGRKN